MSWKRVKTDIADVKAGDRFVEAPELGEVTNVSQVYFDQNGNPSHVKVWTTDEPVDRWGAPQQVEVYRRA